MRIVSIHWAGQVETGGHKRLIYLLRGLAERGHVVTLLTRHELKCDVGQVEVVKLPSWNLPSSKIDSVASLIYNAIEDELSSTDVIIAFGLGGAIPASYLKYRLGAPLLVALRSHPVKNVVKKNFIKEWFFEITNHLYLTLALRTADRCVVQLKYHKNSLIKRYGVRAKDIEVIPNNILHDLEGASSGQELRELLFVGSVTARKGIGDLLKAFRDLNERNPELRLHVAGKGPLEEWAISYVEENGLSKHVTFHGYVQKPRALMRQCDLVVIPSLVESFPNVALEAMSVGTPFIVSDLPEMRSAFGEGTEYFKPSSPTSLTSKIGELLEMEAYKRLFNRLMQKRNTYRFDWVRKFERIVKEI